MNIHMCIIYTMRIIHILWLIRIIESNGGNMKEILAVINQKGGVGKSTTAYGIGAGLNLKGYKILFIDMDAQGNLTDTLGVEEKTLSTMDVLEGKCNITEAVKGTAQGDLIPAGSGLAVADTVICAVGKEYRLKESLESVKYKYDYIIIDTPPALGVLTINALTACSGAVVPAQADIYSLQGISQLNMTINTVKKYCNPDLKVIGILLTRYSARTILSRDLAQVIGQTALELGTKLFSTVIRESIVIKESQANRQSIFEYAPKSNPALDYLALVDELIEG